MKSISIYLTIPQLLEIRDLITTITAGTDILHKLTCGELHIYQKAYLRLIVKCQAKLYQKRNKEYKISFLPQDAEIICKILKSCKIPLSAYAKVVVDEFANKVSFEGDNIKATFLSQFYPERKF